MVQAEPAGGTGLAQVRDEIVILLEQRGQVKSARELARSMRTTREAVVDSQTVVPLLAGLREVLPWVDQWSPEAGDRYRARFDTWMPQLDLTEPQLADRRTPPLGRGRPRKIT